MAVRNDEHWLAVVDTFNAAALGIGSWSDALLEFGRATGSRAGQLVGFGSAASAHFNWIGDPEQGWVDSFVAGGGADPTFNPRMRLGLDAPALTLITDHDVATRKDRRLNSFYADLLPRFDIPFICATVLARDRDAVIGLAALRSERQGEITREQQEVFASIAPHVRAAVRTQMALENKGADLITGALEALSLAVFVCDGAGKVRATTPAADALVGAGAPLDLKRGELRSAWPDETATLAVAIRRAAAGLAALDQPLSSAVLIRLDPAPPLVLDVVPLPRHPYAFGFEPRALVVVRGKQQDPSRTLLLLQAGYRLTPAEAGVAVQLADGRSPEAIAAERGVSVGTVRVQIRAIYAKLGVRRQTEMVAFLRQLE